MFKVGDKVKITPYQYKQIDLSEPVFVLRDGKFVEMSQITVPVAIESFLNGTIGTVESFKFGQSTDKA